MCRSVLRRLTPVGCLLLALGCGRDRVEKLASQLNDGDVHTRRAAAHSLRELEGDRLRAIPILTDALVEDDDVQVRRLSTQALGEIGPPAAPSIPTLLTLLQEPDESLRVAAALAVARISPDNESCRPVLVQAIRTGNGGVLLAIGAIGADAAWAVPTLIQLLSDERVQIRSLAARTLRDIGPAASDATPALERMAHDRDTAVRELAKQALESIRDNSAPASQ